MEKKYWFLAIGIFWLAIIIGFIGFKEFTLRTGQEVLLKTQPVDPRDLFRGDYVILNYQISTLDLDSLQSDFRDFKDDQYVYVSLDLADGYGAPAKISRNAPEEGLYLKGKVIDSMNSRLAVSYGIESYFVPEGEGREIERYTGRGLDVKVSIDKFGNAVIKSLLVDGKEVSFE